MRTPTLGARAFIPMALAGAGILTLASGSSGAVAAAEPTEGQQIVKIAKAQVGDPYRYGAKGPRSFDCSGLVIYTYTKAGDAKVIGNGKYRSARAMYRYFRSKGMASRSDPRIGDIVVWGGGTHVGIYVGDGKAVSALTRGVRVHKVHAVTSRFTAYLHTGMSERAADGAVKAATSGKIQVGDVRHTDGRVNLRKGPGVGNARITTLRNDHRLVVLGKRQDSGGRWWLKVDSGSHDGWVAKWLTD